MKNRHPRAITESQVKSAVKNKVTKMQTELQRNPNNIVTRQRLADFKKLHRSKLEE